MSTTIWVLTVPFYLQPTHVETQTDGCIGCEALTKERRKIWNKYVALKAKFEASVKTKRSRGVRFLFSRVQGKPQVNRSDKRSRMAWIEAVKWIKAQARY